MQCPTAKSKCTVPQQRVNALSHSYSKVYMQCPTAKCKCSVPQQSVNAAKCKCSVPQQWVHYISPWCTWPLSQFLCLDACVWGEGGRRGHTWMDGGRGGCVHANVWEGEIYGRLASFLHKKERKNKQTGRLKEKGEWQEQRVAEYHEHNIFFHSSVPQRSNECVCTSALLLQTSVSSVQYTSRGPHITSLHL